VRRQQHDIALLLRWVRDFTEKQQKLFLFVATFVARYRPSDLQRLVDADVEDAARTLAATMETASKGVIYEHPAASAAGSHLIAALKPVLAEARTSLATNDGDAVIVLRQIENGCRELRASASEERAFVELLGRMTHPQAGAAEEASGSAESARDAGPRLIVP
jgi:hypothetical protein